MIEIQHLTKTFRISDGTVEALRDVNLTIGDGDIFGIIGMSGAGKSTLVRCINMLERPTEGTVLVDGIDLSTLTEKQLREKRREITMIFQGFNLLMQRTCLDNICFPLELSGTPKKEARKLGWADRIVGAVRLCKSQGVGAPNLTHGVNIALRFSALEALLEGDWKDKEGAAELADELRKPCC